MQRQKVEVKEVDVLIRGIWRKKKFTDIQKGQTFKIEENGRVKKYIARTDPYWDDMYESYIIDLFDKNKISVWWLVRGDNFDEDKTEIL
ncbi:MULTISPECIES: hypothetical protein [Bacillus]|uniref:YopX protein domain-containing protein n=1 Tax=Bacillus velezensis TaxID=492670 RepID=A0ABC8D9Y2_BACVE|nr:MULTISPECIES: hypothetical protein [Bacillus]ANB49308.1 hypothetical protein A1D33_018640 [Bacillus velezensis]AVI28961.1 hypothetical protein C3Z10_11485 [Bacillus velezensis]AWX72615.1 hypothetical protein BVDSYZ_11510 [Bacillus velezensis]MBR7816805.1 hypothetical protein [Bacillus sp. CCNWLCWHY013]MDK2560132.1 hypothetical protein [Bacillus amyloliquefaciens]